MGGGEAIEQDTRRREGKSVTPTPPHEPYVQRIKRERGEGIAAMGAKFRPPKSQRMRREAERGNSFFAAHKFVRIA